MVKKMRRAKRVKRNEIIRRETPIRKIRSPSISYYNAYVSCPRCYRRVTVSLPRHLPAYCMKCRSNFDIESVEAELTFRRQM